MRKIAVVLFVLATALAACGKKKAPDAPKPDTTAPAAGSGDATPAAGSGGGSGM
jgi:hypothetical protein